jgi:hypothetical protein
MDQKVCRARYVPCRSIARAKKLLRLRDGASGEARGVIRNHPRQEPAMLLLLLLYPLIVSERAFTGIRLNDLHLRAEVLSILHYACACSWTIRLGGVTRIAPERTDSG